MALLTTKQRVVSERPTLTTSIDAALRCFDGSRPVPAEFAQDILLALGVLAETREAPSAVRREIASCLDAIGDERLVPSRVVVDGLLDVRRALDAPGSTESPVDSANGSRG